MTRRLLPNVAFLLRLRLLLLLLLLLPLLQHVDGAPSQIKPRALECRKEGADFDERCWAELDMTRWLNQWSPPYCTSDNTTDCCLPTTEWSTCFIKMNLGGSNGYNCTTIAQGVCEYDQTYKKQLLPPSAQPQVRYALLAIFYAHAFFNNWYTAYSDASLEAMLNVIDGIVQLLDPPKAKADTLNTIMGVLTAGLAFVPGVGTAAQGLARASNAFVASMQQAPGVAKTIWPLGTTDSQLYQIREIKEIVGKSQTLIHDQLNRGLHLIMNDKATFAAFASTGWLSGTQAPSIPDDTKRLGLGLSTYIVTKALNGNGWFAQGVAMKSPLTGNVSEGLPALCQPWQPEATATCRYIEDMWTYWSLNHHDHSSKAPEILNTIIQKEWTHMDMLFDWNIDCARSENWGTGNIVTFRQGGDFDFKCVSQLDACIQTGAHYYFKSKGQDPGDKLKGDPPCYTELKNGGCPVRDCTTWGNGDNLKGPNSYTKSWYREDK